MNAGIQPIVMPKWGLAMQEGTLLKWLVEDGAVIKPGLEICEIETSKITNALEATVSGTLRRRVADEGALLPVGALLGVVSEGAVEEAALDSFIASFQEAFAAAVAEGGSEAAGPETIQVGGRTLRYQRAGDAGSPIVFLHGFGGDYNGWLFNQTALADRHSTYAIDLPGHGGSSKDAGDGSVDTLSDIVAGALEALEVGRAHIVGHSLGGAIAAAYAAKHPGRVSALTLIASAGLGREINQRFIDGLISASGRKDLTPVLQLLFADPSLVTRDMVNDLLKFKRLDGVDAALRAIAGASFAGGTQTLQLRDQLAALKVPTQVIFGAADSIIPAAHAEGLPRSIRVHVLPGTGHMPQMEKAGDVNAFIEELDKTTA
ncbi:MAG: acetoin dehydrogenase dihydrolipoyllysine-residue acetyltransferase subunit [Dongiaceae bacterium]